MQLPELRKEVLRTLGINCDPTNRTEILEQAIEMAELELGQLEKLLQFTDAGTMAHAIKARLELAKRLADELEDEAPADEAAMGRAEA
jgi:hypothetical protein